MLLHDLDRLDRCRIVLASLAGNVRLGDLESHHAFHGVQLDLALLLFTTRLVIQLAVVALVDNADGCLYQLLTLKYGINCTNFKGFVGTVLSAAADPFNRVVNTDQTGQTHSAAETWENAQLYFRKTYFGLLVHHPVIRGKTHFKAATQRHTVDRRYGGERQIFNRAEHLIGLEVVGNEVFFRPGKQVGEFRNVGANNKAVLGTGHDKAFQALLRFQFVSRGAELFNRETVELVH